MSVEDATEQRTRLYQFMLITGVILISINLRPAITTIGPLLGMIRDDVNLTNSSAGLLTSLPLIAFAVMSPFAARIGNRYTYEGAMIIGLIILLIGIGVRSISVLILLFTGTFFAGLGIAILNVLLPGLIKDKFPTRVGLMTSIYSTTMGIVAAIASGVSIPLTEIGNFGWQGSLMVWSIPAVIGIIVWTYLQIAGNSRKIKEPNPDIKYARTGDGRIWRSPLAWQIAGFMGLQSLLFYVTITWLPEILHHSGMSIEMAGWMLSFTQFIGLPASFIVPVLAEKLPSQRLLVTLLTLCCFLGYGGLLIGNHIVLIFICTTLIGFFISGAFAFALTLFGLRTRNAKDASELSGMAQSLGYVLAALGPIFIGFLNDMTGDWSIPIIVIMVFSLLIMGFGLLVSKKQYIYE
jgi:CP family cyanate transporter-like MFS transporter